MKAFTFLILQATLSVASYYSGGYYSSYKSPYEQLCEALEAQNHLEAAKILTEAPSYEFSSLLQKMEDIADEKPELMRKIMGAPSLSIEARFQLAVVLGDTEVVNQLCEKPEVDVRSIHTTCLYDAVKMGRFELFFKAMDCMKCDARSKGSIIGVIMKSHDLGLDFLEQALDICKPDIGMIVISFAKDEYIDGLKFLLERKLAEVDDAFIYAARDSPEVLHFIFSDPEIKASLNLKKIIYDAGLGNSGTILKVAIGYAHSSDLSGLATYKFDRLPSDVQEAAKLAFVDAHVFRPNLNPDWYNASAYFFNGAFMAGDMTSIWQYACGHFIQLRDARTWQTLIQREEGEPGYIHRLVQRFKRFPNIVRKIDQLWEMGKAQKALHQMGLQDAFGKIEGHF